jgi:thiamine-monophosphate kinase
MIEDKNPQLTSIGQLGEFGLIDHLTKKFEVQQLHLRALVMMAVLDFKDKKGSCIY